MQENANMAVQSLEERMTIVEQELAKLKEQIQCR